MLEMARLRLRADGARALDAARLHQLLMSAFPPDIGGRAGAGLLHRLESENAVLAQYGVPANWHALDAPVLSVATREIESAHAAIQDGQRLRFLVHANPTFDAVVDGRRRRTGIRDADRQIEWITRKLHQSGAEPLEDGGRVMIALGDSWEQRSRRQGGRLTHRAVAYRGVLVVHSAEALRGALRSGIGRGKAYGLGLLTVAPV